MPPEQGEEDVDPPFQGWVGEILPQVCQEAGECQVRVGLHFDIFLLLLLQEEPTFPLKERQGQVQTYSKKILSWQIRTPLRRILPSRLREIPASEMKEISLYLRALLWRGLNEIPASKMKEISLY